MNPQDSDSIIVDPLVPDNWDYFCLDDVNYHGCQVSIVWNRYGSKYNLGVGFQIIVDSVSVASSPEIKKLSAYIKYKPDECTDQVVNYAVNNTTQPYPISIASFPGIEHPLAKLNDGQYWYLSSTTSGAIFIRKLRMIVVESTSVMKDPLIP